MDAHLSSCVCINYVKRRYCITYLLYDTKDDTKKDRRYEILDVLKRHPGISRDETSKKLNIPPATIARDLKCMQELNMIERIGSRKDGYWKVK